MDWKRLRQKVLEENYPSDDELEEARQKFWKISRFIESEFGLETHFAGSTGRGTCMSGDKDIDIFVLFPEDTERKELEDRGLEIGKKVFERFDGTYRVEYAEHPYTQGKIEGHEIEIVPCYDTEPDEIKSNVDRTPHHSRWASENLDQKQRRDVVLFKTFLRAHGLYGSSLKTEGFSGYLSEILVVHYGSFREILQEAEQWSDKKIIDPEDAHEEGLSQDLQKKFSDDRLVVIDPVDPERNVAAVLSNENYSKFIHAAWKFSQDPGIERFREPEIVYEDFELEQEVKKRGDILVLEFEAPDEVEDVVYPQMRKAVSRIVSELRRKDFRVFNHGFHVSEPTRIFFELEQDLPGVYDRRGPKVFHGSEHISQFHQKYDNVFVEGERLKARTEREYTDAKKMLQDFLSGGKEELEEKGIPGHVAETMEGYGFTDPLEGDEKWLKYLAEKLHVAEYERD